MKDGGPAYPCTMTERISRTETHEAEYFGMTMRQYYKAAAITGLLAAEHEGFSYQGTPEEQARAAATQAGKIADAMIAEDQEHEEGE